MKESLHKGICPLCGSCWPSVAALKRHKPTHKNDPPSTVIITYDKEDQSPYFEDEESIIEIVYTGKDTPMPVFEDLNKILKSSFQECSDGFNGEDEY